jgi:hypothetical protein
MDNYTLESAIKIFALTDGIYTLNDVKGIYRRLAHKNHPDKLGGNTEIMQLINNAYGDFCTFFEGNERLTINQHLEKDDFIDFEFINELKNMQGVVIEICGCWVWLRGNTFTYKDKIQQFGFKFSGAKKSWYWSPSLNQDKRKRGSKTMNIIRKQYGSKIVHSNTMTQIN